MWNYLSPQNLIDLQRDTAIDVMGQRARALLKEGYAVEADRVLDELSKRMHTWNNQCEA